MVKLQNWMVFASLGQTEVVRFGFLVGRLSLKIADPLQ